MADQAPNPANGNANDDKKRNVIAGTTETGTPPLVPSGSVQTMIFKFHDFAELSHKKDDYVKSKSIKCHGYDWYLRVYPGGAKSPKIKCHRYDWLLAVYPGGRNSQKTKDGYVGVFLGLSRPGYKVKAVTTFRCSSYERPLPPNDYRTAAAFGVHNWEKREQICQDCLDSDGSLTIEVDLDIYVPKPKVWYPQIVKEDCFLSKLYGEEDETNASFDINGNLFDFHRDVLKFRAPGLYETVQECEGKGHIPISDVDENVFDIIRQYIYTVLDIKTTGISGSLDTTKAILVAADKYECTSLKLYTESVLVDKFLTPDTCAALLVLADSHSCPLLKEASQKLYKQDPAAVSKSDGWNTVIADCPKLLGELLHYCTATTSSYDENDVDTWDVAKLRTKLEGANLVCDGSKEMLVKRWKGQQGTK